MSNKPHKAEKKITKISAQSPKEAEPQQEAPKTNNDQTKTTPKEIDHQKNTSNTEKDSPKDTQPQEAEQSNTKKNKDDISHTEKNPKAETATKDNDKTKTKITVKSAVNTAEPDTKTASEKTAKKPKKSNQDIKEAVLEAAQTDFAEPEEEKTTSATEPEQSEQLSNSPKTVTLGTKPPELPVEERRPLASPNKKARKADKKTKKSDSKNPEEKPLREVFILARPFVAIGRYLRDSWRELRQVRWPNRRTAWQMTLAVLIYCVIFVALIMALDAFFTFIFNLLLG